MKFVKRITALFLAMVMVMAVGITAFADEASTYTITAPDNGHTYEVYQIFTGDLSNGKLSNVKYGTNAALPEGAEVGDVVPEATLTTIAAISGTNQEKADGLAKYVDLNGTPVATLTGSGTYSAAPGYYLIKDKDGSIPTGEAATTYLVKVVGDVTIAPKSEVPSFEKKIKDTNDTTGVTSDWQDSADYDIGDAVPFQLKGTVAANYADYTHYYFEFSDQMEKSLTFNKSSVKVYIDGTELTDTSKYTVSDGSAISSTDTFNGGTAFTVVFDDLKTIDSVEAGSVITIEYTATLNDEAVLGSNGNVNEAKLIYSNNPNNKGEGKPDNPGETPWDNVIVFTYKVVINKVDNSDTALAGAAFKLEKEIEGANGAQNTWTTVEEFTAGDATSFTFSGLDDGNYRLTETTTPAGYNTIDPITFTVTAEHNIVWTTGDRTNVLTSLNGNKVSGEITFTSNKTEGSLSANVVNKPGSNLPSTGGMGTTILYVAGVALIVIAGVVIIRRKNA